MSKTDGKELKEKLFDSKKSGWEHLSDEELKNIFQYADEYMYYLNNSKTEKEIVQNSKEILLKNGFCDISEKENLMPGDKVFYVNRGRCIYVAVIGEEEIEKGLNVVAAHCDSPRIDLKQNPLYINGLIFHLVCMVLLLNQMEKKLIFALEKKKKNQYLLYLIYYHT